MGGVAFAVALWSGACGPGSGGADATADGTGGDGSSSAASGNDSVDGPETTMASADESGSATASSSTGNGADCPDNVANEPFCYRAFELEGVPASSSVAVGRLGPGGEQRIAFVKQDENVQLLSWDGSAPVLDVLGVVGVGALQWLPAALQSSARDDLVGDALDEALHIIPNSAEGLQAVTDGPMPPTLHGPMVVIDLDGDGLDEVLVQRYPSPPEMPWSMLQAFRWDGAAWNAWGDPIGPDEQVCGYIWLARAAQLDDDGRTDLVIMTTCRSDLDEDHGYFTMRATAEPLVFESQFWPVVPDPGRLSWLEAADFDGDGHDDVAYRMTYYSDVDARIDVALSNGVGGFAAPVVAWDSPSDGVYGDGLKPCLYGNDEWHAADLDRDGRSELICSRTVVAGLPDVPVVFEGFSTDKLGGTLYDYFATRDITGDGASDLVISSQRSDGNQTRLLLISGP